MDQLDRLERDVVINAPIERVWELVKMPGWWIGEGDDEQHAGQHRYREGDYDVVEDPLHGRFPILTVALDPPGYAAFRWTFGADRELPTEANSTLVEFRLTDAGGSTRLGVVESGFASLPLADEERRRQYDGNVEGWAIELAYARRAAEAVNA